jgi:serine/threonine-protein phosphatase 2A activator
MIHSHPAPPLGAPLKWITNADDVESFRKSDSFAKILLYINACANACRGCGRSQVLSTYHAWVGGADGTAATPPAYAKWMRPVADMFVELRTAVESIPLQDMKDQRFGNKAFRDFHAWLETHIRRLLAAVVRQLPKQRTDAETNATVEEMAGYIKDSFGNATRIDFGTGHELHYFLFIVICLEECSAMSLPEEEQQRLLGVSTLCVFWDYIAFMRMVQSHYKLEPAGSHGVWGLDDYHHLSFIFGASQLVGREVASAANPNPILPKHITEGHHVDEQRDEYLYFSNIGWIRDHKKGPFHEHSSMLYNISGIDEWSRIASGMIRMFEAEVLSKYNVVQHLLFGEHLPHPLRQAA